MTNSSCAISKGLENEPWSSKPTGFSRAARAALISAAALGLLFVPAPARADLPPALTTTSEPKHPASTGSPPPEPDVIESVDDSEPNTASVEAPPGTTPLPSPPATAGANAAVTSAPSIALSSSDEFELHGWARQSLELGLAKGPSTADDRTAVPYDQLTARSQLFMRARYGHGRWFEANISGALSYSLLEQAPARSSTTFNGINGQSARGVLEPRLHELFVGLFTRRLDVRIGQQRVAWGNSDFMSPNDVMNARDLRDPFVSETELRRIPTFMIRADLDLGQVSLQGIVEPVYTPDLYDVSGSNWAGIQPDAPRWARGLANLARRSLDPTLREPTQRLLMATRYPKSDFTEPVAGLRLGWSVAGFDVNYYYQYGFDGPQINVDPQIQANLASVDFQHAGLVALDPWLAAIDAGGQPLQSSYVRRHHAGLDLATNLGAFALRVDAAYDSKRVFYSPDLTSFVSPTFQGVLGTEYQTGDKAKLALFELIYVHLVHSPGSQLLVYERDSFGFGGDLRWPIWRALGCELRALVGIVPRTAALQPQLALNFDHLVLSAGALWLDGEQYSFGAHFRRNTETYVRAKVLF